MTESNIRAIALRAPGLSSFGSRLLRSLAGSRFNPLSRTLRNGGITYADAVRIADRKSTWMVLWLRSRRDGDPLRGYYRRNHFARRA